MDHPFPTSALRYASRAMPPLSSRPTAAVVIMMLLMLEVVGVERGK